MVTITLKVGPKGQIVIPKSIRESLGIIENHTVALEVKDKVVQLKPTAGTELVRKWEQQAQQLKIDVAKEWIYGDRLYEEEFS